jgi:hypothetical protein
MLPANLGRAVGPSRPHLDPWTRAGYLRGNEDLLTRWKNPSARDIRSNLAVQMGTTRM